MNQWFLSFLTDNYGQDFRQMKQYGFVILDVPMLGTAHYLSVRGGRLRSWFITQILPDPPSKENVNTLTPLETTSNMS